MRRQRASTDIAENFVNLWHLLQGLRLHLRHAGTHIDFHRDSFQSWQSSCIVQFCTKHRRSSAMAPVKLCHYLLVSLDRPQISRSVREAALDSVFAETWMASFNAEAEQTDQSRQSSCRVQSCTVWRCLQGRREAARRNGHTLAAARRHGAAGRFRASTRTIKDESHDKYSAAAFAGTSAIVPGCQRYLPAVPRSEDVVIFLQPVCACSPIDSSVLIWL